MGRSGGTLLLRLFDGHPACLVIPHELASLLPADAIGRSAEGAFDALTPRQLAKWRASGVTVGKSPLAGPRRHMPPFDLSPALVRKLFVASFPERRGDRETLDAYFSAYFSAWRGLAHRPMPPRWVIGFEPGAIGDENRMSRFDANYPDGRVISVLRDPWSWFVSARRWSLRFAHIDVALTRWRRTVECALAYRRRHPERIALVAFNDLLLDTRGVMGRLCAFLDIPFDEVVVTPTLNGSPSDDNSSFGGGDGGISRDPVTNRRAQLSDDEVAVIETLVGPLWNEALEALGGAAEDS
jgi:hypothetical protein